MAVAARTTSAFDAEVARAVEAVGASASDSLIDGLTDPIGAARALSERGAKPPLLRAVPALGTGSEGYGPTPADSVWIRPSGSSIRIAPLRLDAGGKAETAEVARVAITSRQLSCCESPACNRQRTHLSAWVVLAGGSADGARTPRDRWLVAEVRSLDAARAEAQVEAFAARLARVLGVPLETAHGTEPADAIAHRAVPERDGDRETVDDHPPPGVADLARFVLRTEGDYLVLRDHASIGPRTTAPRNVTIGSLLLAVSVPLWIQVARSLSAGQNGLAIGLGASAMLISLTAYAFLGVARFAVKYVALSSPLFWLAKDRIVVAPWVSRVGGIDLKPEGRFGAGIPLGELNGVHVRAAAGSWAVELDTEHGPIDVVAAPTEQVARHLAVIVSRAAASVRHPGGPSLKQRLRARARQQAEAHGGSAARGAAAR
ncbi:hypothetical protein [Chondromyces crocatus]|uniref:Uncharacterized protein n=1 Tax=Chondromyces crocatus TaxID=52 RepID=A0A0K1ENN3_CHOCO|nr:hypothetical protein [Chondromyces crocatus]AKT42208.1 uncharacterized protein CMC5_064310 [Chondromyces crocatus]